MEMWIYQKLKTQEDFLENKMAYMQSISKEIMQK